MDETNVYPFNLGEGKLANAEENDIWYYKGEALRGLGNEQQAIDCFIKATIGSSEPQQAFFYKVWHGVHWVERIRHAAALTN